MKELSQPDDRDGISFSEKRISQSTLLLSITFVPSAFYAYVWRILEGMVKRRFFPVHIIEMGFV